MKIPIKLTYHKKCHNYHKAYHTGRPVGRDGFHIARVYFYKEFAHRAELLLNLLTTKSATITTELTTQGDLYTEIDSIPSEFTSTINVYLGHIFYQTYLPQIEPQLPQNLPHKDVCRQRWIPHC